ncbi:MAG: 1-acyl-sn-glycerol-3-phosphate acyltransferase [Alistipes sp.]|nr:1-acyl-sn-glycerol-3-phosphate acyltransferase [Alistipes sp.]
MSKQRKIQDSDWLYSFLRPYVDFVVRLSYREMRFVGRERIPKDSAIIFAPNHTGTLMDALVLLAMDRSPKVFVARADIFKKPILAKIFAFLKIMPIMRMRDGIDEVKRNNETIERAVDVLRDNIPFCIFPEGMHQTKFSTLPLSKGIFRIAFQAQELMTDKPLYIVPMGIRYGNFFRFRSTVRIQIGEPINVGAFIAERKGMHPQEQMNEMRTLLEERMRESILYIPNDEDYNATYETCAAVVSRQEAILRKEKEHHKLRGLNAYFTANNRTVKQIQELKSSDPERARRILDLANEARALRTAQNISLKSVALRFPVLSNMLKGLIFLLLLPYILVTTIASLPTTLLSNFLNSKFKDAAFHNSVRFLVNLVAWPVMMIMYAIVAYIALPWQFALALTLAILPSPLVADDVYRLIRLWVSDFKLWRNKPLRKKYAEIRDLMF